MTRYSIARGKKMGHWANLLICCCALVSLQQMLELAHGLLITERLDIHLRGHYTPMVVVRWSNSVWNTLPAHIFPTSGFRGNASENFSHFRKSTIWQLHYEWPLSPYLNNELSHLAPRFSDHLWVWNSYKHFFPSFPLFFSSIYPFLTVAVLQWLSQLPQDRGTEKEMEQFPQVIKHLNINKLEAWSCAAHTAHMSAPASLYLELNKHASQTSYFRMREQPIWYIRYSSLLDIVGERKMSQ